MEISQRSEKLSLSSKIKENLTPTPLLTKPQALNPGFQFRFDREVFLCWGWLCLWRILGGLRDLELCFHVASGGCLVLYPKP